MLWVLAGTGAAPGAAEARAPKPNCDGTFKISGSHGGDQVLIPTGWKNDGYADVVVEKNMLLPQIGARAYFADTCTAGKYNHTDYMRANLLGKTLRFSTDITGAGCGCNAAFYLTSMGHNKHVSECFDHYCDANNVCGESCAEIDLMEANQHAWHSTLHTATDTDGAASGFGGGGSGWNGPRNWTEKEYGIGGSCIDTAKPFDIAVAFPIDRHGTLVAMQVSLSQKGQKCQLQARVDNYASGMKELTHALLDGMTPIVSYWADDDMLWMDGLGDDKKGPCKKDSAKKCADQVRFFDFSIEDLADKEQKALEKEAHLQDKLTAMNNGDSQSSTTSGDQEGGEGGNEWWHPDKVEGSDKWDGKSSSGVTGSDQESGEGGNEWWHPDNAQVKGSDKWDGKSSSGVTGGDPESGEGGNKWWHPDNAHVKGSDKRDGKASSGVTGSDQESDKGSEAAIAEVVLMKKNEVIPGHLRGTAEPDAPSIAPYVVAAVFAGVAIFAAVAVPLRRRRTPASTAAGEAGADASPPGSMSISMGRFGGSSSLSRLRSFGSRGDLGGQDDCTTPAPMLQQPPSSQNLLVMGSLVTQAA